MSQKLELTAEGAPITVAQERYIQRLFFEWSSNRTRDVAAQPVTSGRADAVPFNKDQQQGIQQMFVEWTRSAAIVSLVRVTQDHAIFNCHRSDMGLMIPSVVDSYGSQLETAKGAVFKWAAMVKHGPRQGPPLRRHSELSHFFDLHDVASRTRRVHGFPVSVLLEALLADKRGRNPRWDVMTDGKQFWIHYI